MAVNKRCDGRLIAWAGERGLLVRVDRTTRRGKSFPCSGAAVTAAR